MCDCDYDAPEVFDEAHVKARKMHRCNECRGWIAPGETYRRSFGVWDGDARTYKTCADCLELIAWADERNGSDICYALGNAIHDIGDTFDEWGDKQAQAELALRWKELRAKRRSVGISA